LFEIHFLIIAAPSNLELNKQFEFTENTCPCYSKGGVKFSS